MSPVRCAPGPRAAMARRKFFSLGVRRSKRTRKKFWSSRLTTVVVASRTILSQAFDFVQQDGFAHSAETRENHAFFGPLLSHPPQKDACLVEDRVSTYQLRRRGARAGREWVLD